MVKIEDPVVPLERDLYGHPLAGFLQEGQFEEKFHWDQDGKRYRIGNAFWCIESKVCSCRYTWTTLKMAGRNQHFNLMWKKLMKLVDLGEPTSFLDHVYLGSTQRVCKPNETIIEQYTKMFESRISAGATEKMPGWEKPHSTTVAWSYGMEGHAKKCVENIVKWQTKKTEQLYKVSTPCLWRPYFQGGGN